MPGIAPWLIAFCMSCCVVFGLLATFLSLFLGLRAFRRLEP
jgi:hypothetical protein